MQEPPGSFDRWWPEALAVLSVALRTNVLPARAVAAPSTGYVRSGVAGAPTGPAPGALGHAQLQHAAEPPERPFSEHVARALQGAFLAPNGATMAIIIAAAVRGGEPRTAVQLCSVLARRGAVPDAAVVNLHLRALAALREWLPALQVLRSAYVGVGVDGESFAIVAELLQAACALAAGQPTEVTVLHQSMDEVRGPQALGACCVRPH